jgi:hypothetical protein
VWEFVTWLHRTDTRIDGYDLAKTLLLWMGRDEITARVDWCDVSLEILRDGGDVNEIYKAMPVNPDMVKEQLRYWRETRKGSRGKK